MNRRLVLFASAVMVSAAVTVSADVPALPHPIGPPVVYAITPNTGNSAGGRWVSIFGRDFNGTTTVNFGNQPAPRFFLISDHFVFARSPSGTAGVVVDVTVTTPLGTSATGLQDQYTFAVVPPVIDALDPRQGTAAGGTRVILDGHGVWGATSVNFGGVTIPCFFPPASAPLQPFPASGVGKLDAQTMDLLQRLDAPTLDIPRRFDAPTPEFPASLYAPTLPSTARGGGTFAPLAYAGSTHGPLAGAGGPGGGRCIPFGDDVHLIVFSPPGTASTTPIDITITTPVGTSPAGPGTKWTYVAPVAPVVNAVGPGHGTANGGTNVTLFGIGFSGASSVSFGPNAMHACPMGGPGPGGQCFFPSGDDTRLSLNSPSGTAGTTVDVTVHQGTFTSVVSQADKYTYDQPGPPQVDAVTPNHGSALGGGSVHIRGNSLTGVTSVRFGSTSIPLCGPSTSRFCFFPGGDSDLFVAAAPAGPANTSVDVTVAVGTATSATGPADIFTFDTATVPIIQAMDPSHGVPNGGTNVNLVGRGFGGVTSLTIGPVTLSPCPPPIPGGSCFFLANDNNIRFNTPVKTPVVPMVAPVTVTNAIGASAPVNFTYDLMGGPVVTGVSPTSGPTSGNTSVWVTGSGFSQASQVTFDTSSASYVGGFYVPPGSDTILQAFTPQVPVGTTTVDIRVKTPSVTSAITAADHFTFTPVNAVIPTVSAVTPSTGPTNSFVALYGSGFSMATKVMFGSTQAFGLFVPNDHLIVTSSPPQGTGTVNVYVTTPAGTNATGATYTFGTTPAGPQVGGLDPFQGTQNGGTNMNIYGVGFNFTASVTFGSTTISPCGFGLPGPCFNVNGDNYIYVNTPPQGTNPAQVDVRVVGGPPPAASGLTSPIVAADKFTWVAPVAPVLNAVDPQQVSTFGGSGVTLYGSGFSAATAVKVGPNTLPPCGPSGGGGFGSCFFAGSDNQISLSVPPASPGTVEVTVTTPTGTSALNPPADQLTYVTPGPPTISAITPTSGPSSGGTVTYISGTNLQGASVSFGPNPTFNIIYFLSSPTLLAVVSPPGSAGLVPLTITTPSGSVATQFTYSQSPAPTIATVNPNHGSADGGTQVVITGTDLGGANGVNFGPNRTFNFFNPYDFFTLNPGPLIAMSPMGPGGTTVDISVTTPAGTSAPLAADQFTYDVLGLPVVSAISPSAGMTEGDQLLISGINLSSATRVNFGNTGVPNLYFFPVAPGVLNAFSPPGTLGVVDITVTTPAGTSAISANDKYTYVATPRPIVSVVSPSHGPPGTFVWISGTTLALNKMGDVVKFGTAVPDYFSQGSGGEINANSPPPPPGSATVDVTVTNDGGTSATTPADLYTFDPAAPPTVTVIAPDNGPAGTRVFITGTNLGGTTEVDFGTDLATSVYVRSDTLVIATSPCDNGNVVVTVKTAAGTATSPNNFKFQRCRGPHPPGSSNPPRTDLAPPLPPGPPSGPRPLVASPSLNTFDEPSPSVTGSVDAILALLRAMSSMLGGP